MDADLKVKLRRLTRRDLPPDVRDTALWAEPDISGWTTEQQHRYGRFKGALVDYLAGEKVSLIEKRYALSISQVQEQLWRATQTDGYDQTLGFNALIPNLQVVETTRKLPMPSGMYPAASRCVGGLIHILQSEGLYTEFQNRVLKRGTGPHAAIASPIDLQKWLVGVLSERNYKKTDYPLNTRRPLYSSIAKLIREIKDSNFAENVRANENETAAGNLTVQNGRSMRQARAIPLDEVEADEHKLHGIACVKITVDGVDKLIPTERAVGIAIVCRGTRAVLGGAVCLNPEAKESALIEAIRSAVIAGYIVRLPNGEPAPPFRLCDFQPAFQGAVWNIMRLDNARIHTGDLYQRTAQQIGTWTCFGPLASWSGRPNIEGTFSQLVGADFSKIPSTTGTGPDREGRNAPAEQAIRWEIEHVDLCRLFFNGLAKINLSAGGGLLYQSPCEVARNYFIGNSEPLIRRLPPTTASRPEVGVHPVRRPVCRRSKTDPNMYVSYAGAKYSNDALSPRADLRGTFIILHPSHNLRTVLAFEQNGLPLGELKADGHWGASEHTLEIRRAVNRDKDRRFGQLGDSATPVQVFLEDTAQKVVRKAKGRQRGRVVKGALKLQRQMQDTSTPEIHIKTPQPAPPQKPLALTASIAAERARQTLQARRRQLGDQDEG